MEKRKERTPVDEHIEKGSQEKVTDGEDVIIIVLIAVFVIIIIVLIL